MNDPTPTITTIPKKKVLLLKKKTPPIKKIETTDTLTTDTSTTDTSTTDKNANYRAGTAGFYYKWWFTRTTNQGLPSYYPHGLSESRALTYYSNEFPIVEINNTFYKLPTAAAVKEWYNKTPANFRFIPKLSKYITQDKKLIDFPKLFNEFWFDHVEHLQDKCAGILIQLPPTFVYNKYKKGVDGLSTFERLRNAGLYIKSLGDRFRIPIFIEFRDPSWFNKEVYELLIEIGWSLVVVHLNNELNKFGKMKSGFSPEIEDIPVTLVDHIYFRFHGTWPIPYMGGYTPEILTILYNWTKSHGIKTGYFIFNNTDSYEGEIFSELTLANIPGKSMADPAVLTHLGATISHAIYNCRQMNFIINTDIPIL